MRRVDEYPERRERVTKALIAAHDEAADFEQQLTKHFFPEPTDWDVAEEDFTDLLETITGQEVENVIEDLGLRAGIERVAQCQHCGRYFNTEDAILAWVADPSRKTGDPNQMVVVLSLVCGTSCSDRIRENSYRVIT